MSPTSTAKCWTVGPSNMPHSLYDMASEKNTYILPGRWILAFWQNRLKRPGHVGPVQRSNIDRAPFTAVDRHLGHCPICATSLLADTSRSTEASARSATESFQEAICREADRAARLHTVDPVVLIRQLTPHRPTRGDYVWADRMANRSVHSGFTCGLFQL